MYIMDITAPSPRVMVRSRITQPKSQNTRAEARSAKRSMVPTPSNGSGRTTAAHPSTISILKILLPITLPSAIPVLPLSAALTEVASSGSEVPAATMVSPTTASLTPSPLAMAEALSTKRSPPQISAPRPPATYSRERHTGSAFC